MSTRCLRLPAAMIVAAFAGTMPAAANQLPLMLLPGPQTDAPRIHAPLWRHAPADVVTDGEEMAELPARLKRQVVDYPSREAPGTVIIDTPNTYLYVVLGSGRALRYGIGVGREGFTWSGVQSVTRKAEWPDWTPPEEMLHRQPYLPRMMAGGPGNPLGARALYLGHSQYRIHGTNDPATIGRQVSSGCIRLTNEDVTDLYNRVKVGAKVVVLPMTDHRMSQRTGFSTN